MNNKELMLAPTSLYGDPPTSLTITPGIKFQYTGCSNVYGYKKGYYGSIAKDHFYGQGCTGCGTYQLTINGLQMFDNCRDIYFKLYYTLNRESWAHSPCQFHIQLLWNNYSYYFCVGKGTSEQIKKFSDSEDFSKLLNAFMNTGTPLTFQVGDWSYEC